MWRFCMVRSLNSTNYSVIDHPPYLVLPECVRARSVVVRAAYAVDRATSLSDVLYCYMYYNIQRAMDLYTRFCTHDIFIIISPPTAPIYSLLCTCSFIQGPLAIIPAQPLRRL